MPELFAVLVVVAVSIAAWIAAWLQTRGGVKLDSPTEQARLRVHEAWLRQRLALAECERWDAGMTASLTEELNTTTRQLTHGKAS